MIWVRELIIQPSTHVDQPWKFIAQKQPPKPCNLIKKETPPQIFFCEFSEHLRASAFVCYRNIPGMLKFRLFATEALFHKFSIENLLRKILEKSYETHPWQSIFR